MQFLTGEFIRFVMVGVINTLHYYAIYLLCLHVLNIYYFIAHVIALVVSLIGSFFLNTFYTYKMKPTWGAFFRFPLTQLFNTIATAVLLYLLVEFLYVNSKIAPLISVFITIPATFILTGRIVKKHANNS